MTEGLLLSVLPVLVTWQGFAAHGWTIGPGRAVGGHIVLHTALNLRGTEMPPYATGGAHIVPRGQQRPAAKTATPVP
jgi:hypothetical protein